MNMKGKKVNRKITSDFVYRLREIVGDERVLDDPDTIERYSCDETPELYSMPDLVVLPETSDEVAEVVKLCYENEVPITPRGAGTGVAGGAVPILGGVVVSLEKMKDIIEVDEKNLIARVQPGIITGEFQRKIESIGLYYPPDPASVDSCSLGGNVATSAGGMKAFKYGTTKNFVYGLEVVLPEGEKVRLGGKMIKDVAGYDLKSLIIGSEGTLGIITEVMVKLVPKPSFSAELLAGFESSSAAISAALRIIPKTGVYPAAMEFMEGEIVKLVEVLLEHELPMSDCAAQIIVALESFDETRLERELEVVGEHLLEEGAVDVLVAMTRPESERLWKARRSIRDAIRHRSKDIAAEDVAVPPTRIPELLEGVKKIGEKHGATILGFGHLGDGNMHIDLLRDSMEDDVWAAAKDEIVPEILGLAVKLGGTITGEHGIGYVKRKYLRMFYESPFVNTIATIKKAIDPKGLMNPEKII